MLGTQVFSGIDLAFSTLYVPEASLNGYSKTAPWSEFGNILPLPTSSETENDDTDVIGLADALYVESQQVVPGAEIEVPLLLKNALEATGFSCTLVLPEGLSIVTDGDGYPDVTAVSERFSNINYVNCYGDFNAEGKVDISCSISNTSRCKLTGNDGAVATFKLRAADKLEKGPYPVVLKNIRITNAESTAIDDVTVTFHYGKKWECTHIQGDVNGDGEVTIEDLNTLVDILLGK